MKSLSWACRGHHTAASGGQMGSIPKSNSKMGVEEEGKLLAMSRMDSLLADANAENDSSPSPSQSSRSRRRSHLMQST